MYHINPLVAILPHVLNITLVGLDYYKSPRYSSGAPRVYRWV